MCDFPSVRVPGISALGASSGRCLVRRRSRALAVFVSLFLLAACSPEAPRSPTGPGVDATEAALRSVQAASRQQESRIPFQKLRAGPAAPGMKTYFLEFESPVTRGDVERIEALGGGVKYVYDITSGVAAFLPAAAVTGMAHLPGVTKVVPVEGKVHAIAETKWGVSRIEAAIVWANEGNQGAGIKVAILDSGIDLGHPDLDSNVKGGVSFAPGPSGGQDDNGHGTHVAGILAAEKNGTGVVGVAPKAWLYAVKVLPAAGGGDWDDIVAGINWAKNNGMRVINMSLGDCGNTPQSTLDPVEAAVDAAYAAGIVLVAAGGNGTPQCPTRQVSNPARFANVIAVAGTQQNDSPPGTWSVGPEIEVAAPGVGIPSTFLRGAARGSCTDPGLGNGYATCSGTSMASPHVAGTVALMLNEFPFLTPQQVREKLRFYSSRVNNQIGYGIVNAAKSATNTPVATIEGPICLESPGTYTYFANTSGGGGGNFWTWFRRKAGTSTWVNEGTGVSEGIYFRAGSYGDDVKVEVEDRWGKETATITTVFMDSGAGAQVAGGGPTTNATVCGGGGGPPPV